METEKAEVIVVDMNAKKFNSRKEVREFELRYPDRDKFFCRICHENNYPECKKICYVGQSD